MWTRLDRPGHLPVGQRSRPRVWADRTGLLVVFAVALLAVMVLVLAACAAGPNTAAAASGPGVAGFWLGLWHGLISPITFIVSLFNDGVSIYEVHNNGGWYDFGFMIGISVIFSGPASTSRGMGRRARGTKD